MLNLKSSFSNTEFWQIAEGQTGHKHNSRNILSQGAKKLITTNLKPHAVHNFTDDKEWQNPQSSKDPRKQRAYPQPSDIQIL